MSVEEKLDKIREDIFNAHDYLLTSYYVNNLNMDVGDERTNDVALFSLMTGLLNKNQLILGNYGLGKTTVSEAVTSLLYNLPVEFIERTKILGHPQLTEEKIVGRLDFSKLNETEKVIFSLLAQSPSAKIIDEINRIPEGTQNTMLGFVESGNFQYLNEVVSQPRFPFFATANYKDGGNTQLTPPLLDRFDVSVEVSFPRYFTSVLRGNIENSDELKLINAEYLQKVLEGDIEGAEKYRSEKMESLVTGLNTNNQREKIKNKELANKIQELLLDKKDSLEQKVEKVRKISAEFKEQTKGISIEESDRKSILYILNTINFSKDAELYLDSFFDSINSVLKVNGESNHNNEYIVGKVENNLSVRANMRSAHEYAKLLTFLKNEEEVSVETVQDVLPYVINHRLNFSDKFTNETNDYLSNSKQFEKSRKIVKDYTNGEYLNNRAILEELYGSLRTGTVNDFLDKYPDSDLPIVKQLNSTFRR